MNVNNILIGATFVIMIVVAATMMCPKKQDANGGGQLMAESGNLMSTAASNGAEKLVLADVAGNLKTIAFPKGMIMLWHGAHNTIPHGWALCNGDNGTPNLSGRFVVGYQSGKYSWKATGGKESVSLTESQMPKHSHSMTFKQHDYDKSGSNRALNNAQVSRYKGEVTMTTNSKGSGSSHENRPPYYALCYIMKL